MPSGWEEDLENSNFLVKMVCREVKDGLHIMSLKRGATRTLEPVPEEEEEESEIKSDMENGVVAQDAQSIISSSVVAKERSRKCIEVIVSHVESRKDVWVQEVAREQELHSMLDELQTLAHPNLEVLDSPQLGDFVATTFSEDCDLYRARVVSSGPSRCTVIFVDFGNREEKDKVELLKLPLHLQEEKLPAFAEQVTVAESDGGWSKEQLENLNDEVVAMFLNCGGEAVLNRIDDDQRDQENNWLASESGADRSKEHLDSVKVDMNSRGGAVSGRVFADQGDQEDKSDENNNVPISDSAMETIDGDPDEAAGTSVEEYYSVTTSLSMNSESGNDHRKFDQTINFSTSHQMKKTIIDASDDEECDLEVEATLSLAAEQEAGVEEKSKQPQGRSCFDPEIEMALSPSRSLEDNSGFLDLADAEADELVDKLMAEGCWEEEKKELLAGFQSGNLLSLAIHPTSSQV